MKIFTWLRAALFPYKCLVCRQEGAVLCSAHKNFKVPIVPAAHSFKYLDQLYAATDYHQLSSQRLVQFLKFYGHRYTAHTMAGLMADRLEPELWGTTTVVPLPLHWSRQWPRGFNQSYLLAKALQPYVPTLRLEPGGLKRTRFTRQQARLNRVERLKNMQQAFAWQGAGKPPSKIILLDDVSTTGSTLEAAAQALKQAGAQQVVGVVFAYQSLGH